MRIYQLRPRLKGGNTNVAGATLGGLHIEPLLAELETSAAASDMTNLGGIVVVDFEGVTSATASYLKATVLALLHRAGAPTGAGVAAPEPMLNVFPVVAGLNDELRDELRSVLALQQIPCIEALSFGRDAIERAHVHGPLDRALRDTLEVVRTRKRASATALHGAFPQQPPISSTAWNNRLSDLHARRLLRRERDGRQWQYQTLAGALTYG